MRNSDDPLQYEHIHSRQPQHSDRQLDIMTTTYIHYHPLPTYISICVCMCMCVCVCVCNNELYDFEDSKDTYHYRKAQC